MAVSNNVNGTAATSSSTETTAESTAAELQQKIQEAYAKLKTASQEMGASIFKAVEESVAATYERYAEALKNPTQPHDFEKDFAEFQAAYQALQEPILENDPDAAQKKQEKEAAAKEFRETTKKYAKSETAQAMEEDLKATTDEKSENVHHQRAERATEMRTALLRDKAQNNRSQVENQVFTQAARDVAEKKQGLFAALIKAPKAPTAEPVLQPTKKLPAEGLPKEAQANNKKPVNTTAGQQEADGPEAFNTAFDENGKPIETADPEVAVANADGELTEVAEIETAANAELTPQKAEQSVQLALNTGVLPSLPDAAKLLDPKRDVTQVMREIQASCNGMLAEADDMTGSAMVFALRGAVRNSKVQGLKTLVQGDTRRGDPEAMLAELQRVQKSAELATSGVGSKRDAVPATIVGKDGKVSSSQSVEQLGALVGQSARLGSSNVGPLSCFAKNVSSWNLEDSKGTVGAGARGRSDVLA